MIIGPFEQADFTPEPIGYYGGKPIYFWPPEEILDVVFFRPVTKHRIGVNPDGSFYHDVLIGIYNPKDL